MKKHLYIKNMVCDRCKSTLKNEIEKLNVSITSIELGEIVIDDVESNVITQIENIIRTNGFELVKEESDFFVEQIKAVLIEGLNNGIDGNISEEITLKLSKDYSWLSKLFSKKMGMTIEKFFINLKIEKVKEYLQISDLNFSEIAYSLNYKSSSHLAKQFKNVTGMSMSDYKNSKQWNRKNFDKII